MNAFRCLRRAWTPAGGSRSWAMMCGTRWTARSHGRDRTDTMARSTPARAQKPIEWSTRRAPCNGAIPSGASSRPWSCACGPFETERWGRWSPPRSGSRTMDRYRWCRWCSLRVPCSIPTAVCTCRAMPCSIKPTRPPVAIPARTSGGAIRATTTGAAVRGSGPATSPSSTLKDGRRPMPTCACGSMATTRAGSRSMPCGCCSTSPGCSIRCWARSRGGAAQHAAQGRRQ